MTERLNHKLDTSKIKTFEDVKNVFECMNLYASASEDAKDYELIKEYFTIPNPPQELKFELPRKSLEEIFQELDEKFEKLIERTHLQYRIGHDWTYTLRKYNQFCKDQDADFEYARENGFFPVKYTTIDYTTLSAGIGCASYEQSLVIKQGNKHEGYYTFGNRRYFRYYMPDKPTAVVRFFMKNLLGFWWVDDKNG